MLSIPSQIDLHLKIYVNLTIHRTATLFLYCTVLNCNTHKKYGFVV